MSDIECEACAAGETWDDKAGAASLEEHHSLIARLRAELAAATDVERLAEAEHEQWVRWARDLLEREPGISQARRERWSKLFVPYAELSEESKEQDRKEACRALPDHPDAGVK